MRGQGLRLGVLGLVTLLGTPVLVSAQDALPSVAIADIAVTPGGYTLAPPQLGPVIVDLLVTELTASRQYHVYDGQWLVSGPDRAAQGNLDRLRSLAGAQHVDYLVLGTVTSFSMEHGGHRGGALLPKPFPFAGGLTSHQARLAVDLSLRVVDVRTGEIVSSVLGSGLATRKSRGLALGGLLHGLPLGMAVAASAVDAASARDAMLNEAVKRAVHSAAAALSAQHLVPGA